VRGSAVHMVILLNFPKTQACQSWCALAAGACLGRRCTL
jgi:hypothetical protein